MSILRYLRRTTASGRLIPEVDGLRFIAIFSVVVFHLSGYLIGKSSLHASSTTHWLAVLATTGDCGVSLFFMISGFILALPWLAPGQRIELRPYFLRRLTRLEPPYLLSLAGLTLAYYVTRRPAAQTLLPHLMGSAAYLHTSIFGSMNPVNCVTWSLETEIQFYALLPVLALTIFGASATRRRATLAVLILVGCGVSYLVRDSTRLALSLLGYSQYFLAGILISDLRSGWQEKKRTPVWDLLGAAGFALVPVADLLWPAGLGPPVLLGLSLIFVSALRGRWVGRVLSSPTIVIIGGMCYSIYLLHYPLISFIGRHTLPIGETLTYPLYLLVQTLIVACLMAVPVVVFFACVERPCMDRNWPSRLRHWAFRRRVGARETEASG